MNNSIYYKKLENLIIKGLKEIERPCETELVKICVNIGEMILNREKKDWSGKEMLGKIIIYIVNDLKNN